MMPWEHVVEQDGPTTPVGMLQRGSGAGALWALSATPKKAHAALLRAMCWDARWDNVMEKRALFYSRIALDLRLDLAPFFAHIRANDAGTDFGERIGKKTGLLRMSGAIELPMSIAAILVSRGSEQAVAFARRYVTDGLFWRELIEQVASLGGVELVSEMSSVLASRFPADQRSTAFATCDPRREPWKSWTTAGTSELKATLEANLRAQEAYLAEYRAGAREKETASRTASTDELLTIANGDFLEELTRRTTEADVATMLAAITPEAGMRAASAIRALGEQLEPRMIEPTARLVESGAAENRVHIQAAPFLPRFPAALVLPIARKWLASGNGSVWHCTRGILWEHATVDDIPNVLTLLKQKVTTKSINQICDALRITASRFGGHGPFKDVRRLFRELPSSWARSWAAKALAATESSFAEDCAYECLWDCETETRRVGVAAVALHDRNARERLQTLAADALEGAETRAAALKRGGYR